jgi:hypothetical protein
VLLSNRSNSHRCSSGCLIFLALARNADRNPLEPRCARRIRHEPA